MSEFKKNKTFLPRPRYKGGHSALKKFIAEQKKYPAQAASNKIKGIVRLRITIDYRGNVVDTQILKSLGFGCDEEADRLARMTKWEIDRKIRRGKVLFQKILNIHFGPHQKANKKDPDSSGFLQYFISSTKPKSGMSQKKPAGTKSKNYTYTIRLRN